MITIIHGDDIVLSRNYLQEQKQNSASPYVFDGIIDLPTIIQITQGSGLFTPHQSGAGFSTQKNVFVENFFSKNKLNSMDVKNLIKYINENESLLNIFFWEANVLQKRSIAIFNNPAIKTFKIPQTIFLFLDSIKPESYKNAINLFHSSLKNTLEELIFFMLQRQFRLLLALRSKVPLRGTPESSQIDEIMRLAPWQKSKLERQARLFPVDKLLTIYKKLYQIDLAQKTGNLPYSLIYAIDFLLLDI